MAAKDYPFDSVTIIYNPNSTGDSVSNTKVLASKLRDALADTIDISLQATSHPAHAEDLARDIASQNQRPLIISASGDGGYNEVINGAIASNNTDAIVAVLPSGNANDHDAAVGERTIQERIISPKVMLIDAIQVDATHDGQPWRRYAHSYVGFGLTPYVGKKLTQAQLNAVREKWLVLKYMILFKGVTLRIGSSAHWRRYSSVVFSNIDRMSKVIKLAPDAKLQDGQVEMYIQRSSSFPSMIGSLLFASTIGFKPDSRIKNQEIIPRHTTDIQLDGEVVRMDGGKKVVVSVAREKIRTLE